LHVETTESLTWTLSSSVEGSASGTGPEMSGGLLGN
jgi:hypothetical protein